MEFFIIVIAIVYSIWSEINKKKQEKDLDFDFSELSSIDDFLKKKDSPPSSMPMTRDLSREQNIGQAQQKTLLEKENQKRARQKNRKQENEFIPLTGQQNYDRKNSPKRANYDKLSSQSQEGSFQQPLLDSDGWPERKAREQSVDITFNRNSLVQAFIMSEVLNRYDINRIYERIPGVRIDEE